MGNKRIQKPWVKVWIRMLHNREVMELPDSIRLRFHDCLLFAGEERNTAITKGIDQEDGYLPPVKDMAWVLHVTAQSLEDDMSRLALAGLVERKVYPPTGEERWYVSTFPKWQDTQEPNERQRQSREYRRERDLAQRPDSIVTDDVTTMSQNVTQNKNKNKNERESKSAPPAPAVTVKEMRASNPRLSPPPPSVPLPTKEPPTRDPVVEDMANALSETTGISARLRWQEVSAQARALLDAGYTAAQLRTHYGRDIQPGAWNWYKDDWRGRGKPDKSGDAPTYKNITETIAGAVDYRPVKEATRKPAGAVNGATEWINRLEKGLNPT